MDCSQISYILSGDCKICGIQSTSSLHRIHRHDVFITVCTSCVLKSNSGSFCGNCFELYEHSNSSSFSPIVHCSRCSSTSHAACVPDLNFRGATFTCRDCENHQGVSYSSVGEGGDVGLENEDRAIAAAQISLVSLTSAAEMLRAKAIEKGEIATIAKKKSIEMLKRLVNIRDSQRKSAQVSSSERASDSSDSDSRKKRCFGLTRDSDPSSLANSGDDDSMN